VHGFVLTSRDQWKHCEALKVQVQVVQNFLLVMRNQNGQHQMRKSANLIDTERGKTSKTRGMQSCGGVLEGLGERIGRLEGPNQVTRKIEAKVGNQCVSYQTPRQMMLTSLLQRST
jgi:hypothetical protein